MNKLQSSKVFRNQLNLLASHKMLKRNSTYYVGKSAMRYDSNEHVRNPLVLYTSMILLSFEMYPSETMGIRHFVIYYDGNSFHCDKMPVHTHLLINVFNECCVSIFQQRFVTTI